MKKLLKNLWMIPLVTIGLLLADSCKTNESDYQCETVTVQGETIKACCNDTQCYYEWDGKKYYCDGHDCEAAAKRLANDIVNGGGKTEPIDDEVISEIVNKLLDANR